MTRGAVPLISRTAGTPFTVKPWCALFMLAALLGTVAAAHRVNAQTARVKRPPGSVTLGPRVLDYRMDCIGQSTCRVQCFQQGKMIIDRGGISKDDQLRMFASISTRDEVIPRWIEIRSADGSEAQTLLLSSDTSCDLKSLTISPNEHP